MSSYALSEVEEAPSYSADEVEESPTAQQASAAIDQIARPQSPAPIAPVSPRLSLGPSPRRTAAEGILTEQQASAALDQAIRPQSPAPIAPVSPRLSLGPSPRTTAEGLVTEQQERRAGMPLKIQPPSGSLENPHPENIAAVPRPNATLAAPSVPRINPQQEDTLQLPGHMASGRVGAAEQTTPEEFDAGIDALTGRRGYPVIARGLKELYGGENQPGTLTRGATDVLKGAGTAATPLMIAGAIAQPEIALLAGAGAAAGGYGAKKLAEVVKASPDTRDLLEQVGQLVGGTAGGVAYGGIKAAVAPEVEYALTNLLWKRGYIRDAQGEPISFASPYEASVAAQEILRQNPGGIVSSVRRARGLNREAKDLPKVSYDEGARRASETAQWNYRAQQATNHADDVVADMSKLTRPQLAEYLDRADHDPEKAKAMWMADEAAKAAAAQPEEPAEISRPAPAPPSPTPAVAPAAGVQPQPMQEFRADEVEELKPERVESENGTRRDTSQAGRLASPATPTTDGGAAASRSLPVAAGPDRPTEAVLGQPRPIPNQLAGTESLAASPTANRGVEAPAPAALAKGDSVTLPDGRAGQIKYVSPEGKSPVVTVSVDGKTERFVGAKEVAGLKAVESNAEITHARTNPSQREPAGAPEQLPGDISRAERQSTDAEVSRTGEAARSPEVEAPVYKFGSTQANIPDESPAAKALETARARISKEDLAGDGIDVGGNHVTVRYGIKGEDTETIKSFLSAQAPFEASLGSTEIFPPSKHSDGAAVIHAPIVAPELHEINAELEKHGDFAEPSFDEYKPHATVAYVKPEKAHRYLAMNVTKGQKFPVNEIAITDREGNQQVVKLEGKKEVAAEAPKVAPRPERAEIPHGHWMNEADIEQAVERHANHPTLSKATKFLKEYMDEVNSHSDGWPYWRQPAHAAEQLEGLIQYPESATEEALAKALVPIKAFMTKRGAAAGMTMPQIAVEPNPKSAAPKATAPKFTVTKADIVPTEEGSYVAVPHEFNAEDVEEAKPETGAASLAQAVYEKLSAGDSLGDVTQFNKLAEQHFGSSRVSGQWTPKDAFDAMEAGVNKYLLKIGKQTMARPVPEALQVLRTLMKGITSQATRTEGQIKAQQFSTPPTESYVAAKVADLKPSDVVLEPSAGNGGLAVWPKAIGAETHVNEIGPQRQKMLEFAGFGKPSAHDGEIINSLLDPKIKPTVILMNPPFSAGVLKGENVKNSNQYGFNHVNSALQRLEENGRLVAILGGGQANEPNGGAALTTGSSGDWFQQIAKNYTVRANVRISGKEYQKYGTAFATRIIVIDKVKPTEAFNPSYGRDKLFEHVVKGNVDTLEEAYTLLQPVAESRPAAGRQDDTARITGSRSATELERPTSARQVEASGSGGAGEGLSATGVRVPDGREPATPREVQPSDRRNQPDRSAGTVQPSEAGERTPVREPGPPAQGSDEAASAENPRSGSKSSDGERSLRQPEVEGLVLGHEDRTIREQEDSSAYVTYKPTLKGPTHPGSIVETKTMSTVPMPEITYHPSLPASVIKEGKLSAVQLEAVSIAGQQNEIVLPDGHRASALIGDGTGVGKGRIGAAVLWDNWNQGRKRLVWVSEKWDLMQDAKRDLAGIGAGDLAKNVKAFQKFGVTDPIEHEGVLFTTYALVRSSDAKGNCRAAQLQKWLRGKDDADKAYMLFDESHNLKNAVVGQMGVASEIGQTVKKLLHDNPNLRTVSLSATAASDVMNLGYLDRLGLWGPGTPFPNGFGEFAANISGGGISAMEMVARELKAQGKYVSRTLSYKGVTYNELEHKLSKDQKDLYRTAVKAWRSVVQQAEKTIKETNNGGHRAVARFMSLFYGAQLRFFNVLLTTLKIPTVVSDANKALGDGKSVVITLVNTNEAAQNREKNRERVKADDDDELPDYDFGPAEMLTDLVREHYPTQQYADGVDDNGNKIKIPVVDGDGNPVHNPQAIQEKNELLAQIKRDLKLPKNPLDILIDSFGGPAKVAELTGRKERYDDNTGKFVKRGDANVKRDEINLAEMRAFQEGKKRLAILSNAAGTGISLHADTNAKNQEKRHHITLQLGWSADKAMQMLGRTHRANQAQPPEYNTIVSDLGGEKRFSAVIAKRLGNLGALSKGQKDANASADAMEKTNFDSDQGKKATQTFYNQLLRNQDIPGTEGWDKENPTRKMTGMSVLRDLAVLKKDPQTGIETVPDADKTNVTRLLNRLLALDPDIQNAVYNYYYDIFTAVVNQAIEDGTLDTGVKALKGDEFHIQKEQALSTDPKTGAKTFYYPVEAQVRTNRVPPKDVEKLLKKNEDARVMQNDKGKLALVRPAADIVHADGKTAPASYVVYPHNGVQQKVENWKLRDFTEVGEAATEKKEKLENDLESAKSNLEYQKRTAERYDNAVWAVAQVKATQDRMDDIERELKELGSGDAREIALSKWKEAYDAAPAHETEEHHLLGGAVLRWWNQIREAIPGTLDIYTAVDSTTGKRVVGVEIPQASIRNLIDRISGSASTVDSGQLSTDVLKNNLNYELERGIQVRKGRVNGKPVVQLIPPNDDIAANLKRLGAIYEKGVTPIYYVPSKDLGFGPAATRYAADEKILDKVLGEYPVKPTEQKPSEEPATRDRSSERGSATPAAINPFEIAKGAKAVYTKFINRVIDQKLDLGEKYKRVAEHDPDIAKMLKEKDNAPRYFHDKAESNVEQVTKGLNESQVRLASMMADSEAREYLEANHPEQFEEAQNDPDVMAAVKTFKQHQDELAQLRIALGWHVRRDLSSIENEDGTWAVVDRDGNEVENFGKSQKDAQEYVEEVGQVLDHLKRTYPEHKREPLMGTTNEGPSLGASYGGIKAPRPDKKKRIATAEYFYEHGAKDFSGYVKSFTQAYHAALNQKIYDSLTDEATKWREGTAQPPQIEYRGQTYYSPDVAKSMKLAKPGNRPKQILEYRAYDPAKDDKVMIRDFANGWSTTTTGRPGISPLDRYLAPKEVVDALEHYDMTRGVKENDSIRRFFQDQIVGLFGPNIHVLNIMRRLSHVVGSGPWDPRVWPYYQKLFFSKELRDRMAEGLADDAIDALSKWGSYTNTRDIGSMHEYFLGNLNPANWVRQTLGKFSKGVLFDPTFMGGFGGLDQKSRVLAYDFLHERAGMNQEEAAKNVEDGFGNYNKANWTERMKRWARALLFPGWDFSSLKWFLRHPIKTAFLPALVTMGANLALNKAGKNRDSDKYDFAYLHYGDRKLRTNLVTESMALHLVEPILEAGKAALEGGDTRDIAQAAGQGVLRGGGGLAGNLRPEIGATADLLSNRQYMGGEKEIWKPEDRNIPGKVLPTRMLDKMLAFAVVKSLPAINRFLDASYSNVDFATGAGSVIGVTNYKSGAEERLKANEAKAMGYSQTLSTLAAREPDAAEKFVQDPVKAPYLLFNKDLSELAGDLKKMDTEMERIKIADMPYAERKRRLEDLRTSRSELLQSADALDDELATAKLQMKKAVNQ